MVVARLEPHHLEDFYAKLHREGLSGASIRKIHWAMRQSLAWANRRGYVTHLATDGVELPPLAAKAIVPPSSDSVAKLIEFALDVDREFGVMLALIAWTGCRRGEVCGLRWRDVNLDAQELVFERSVVAVPGGTLEKSTKTGDSRRIALDPQQPHFWSHTVRCETTSRASSAAPFPRRVSSSHPNRDGRSVAPADGEPPLPDSMPSIGRATHATP